MKDNLDERVEQALRSAALWDEVKDRLKASALGALRRPAAAPVHRARDRRRARRRAARRAGLGARPDLDAGDRGADARAQERVHARDRHAQHAAGRARRRDDRVLQPRRRRGPAQGELVEYDETEKIFTRPPTSAPRTTSPGGSDDVPCYVGLRVLVACTIALCISSATGWVNWTLMSVKPAASRPASYSALERAPAMQPT